MGSALWFAAEALSNALAGPLVAKVGALALLVAGGLTLFGVLALLFGAVRRDDLSRAFRRP